MGCGRGRRPRTGREQGGGEEQVRGMGPARQCRRVTGRRHAAHRIAITGRRHAVVQGGKGAMHRHSPALPAGMGSPDLRSFDDLAVQMGWPRGEEVSSSPCRLGPCVWTCRLLSNHWSTGRFRVPDAVQVSIIFLPCAGVDYLKKNNLIKIFELKL